MTATKPTLEERARELFAALYAADVCGSLGGYRDDDDPIIQIAVSALRAAVAEEREACIATCESERLEEPNYSNEGDQAYMAAVADCCNAIRARGTHGS